jgi:hypothetical protein
MRTVHVLRCLRLSLPFACALLAAPAPAAAPQPDSPGCPHGRYIPWYKLFGVLGNFDLSNGDILRVSREAGRLFAEMDRTGRFEIVAQAEDRFVERGGPVRLDFVHDPIEGDVRVTGLDAPRGDLPACPAQD